MKTINLTPHEVRVFNNTALVAVLPRSGQIARISLEKEVVGQHWFPCPMCAGGTAPVQDINSCTCGGMGQTFCSVYATTKGEVVGLPDPEEATFYVVSALVREALPHRKDLLSPGELVRDENGQPCGCQGLVRN